MGTEHAAVATLLALTGCAGIRSDLAGVREATHANVADVATMDVDPSTPEESRAMLAKPLDVETAVRIAVLDNRELRATLREIGIARGRLVQAWTLPNPTVEAEFTPERESNLELRAEWDVTRLVLAPFRGRAWAANVDAARFRASAAVVEIGWRARAAFYRAQAAKQKLELANQALDVLAASRDAARAAWESGNLPELDFSLEDAVYQNARADTAEMELEAQQAHEALVRVLGLHGADAAFTIAGTLAPVPESLQASDAFETRALHANFELEERKNRIEGLARRAGYASLEGWIPDVAADVHVLQPRDPATGTVANEPWLVGSGIRISVPIFDRNQGESSALAAEAGAELERYYGAAIDLRSIARSIRARLASAHGEARLYQTTIGPARHRVVEQSVLQYNAMRITIFQLIAARRDELRAKLAEIDAVAAYFTARAAFDALLAGHAVRMDGEPAPMMTRSTMRGD